MISEDLKNQIKDSSDITNIIGQYVPSLKRAGSNFKGLCPFHKEKTPSFNVFPETQHFYCFGCQKGGDVYNFVMDHEGLDFPGAMRLLGQQAGIDVDWHMEQARKEGGMTPQAAAQAQQRAARKDDLFRLHDELCTWYEELLFSEQGRMAYEYCRQRGLSDELIKAFRIGFAPDGFDNVKNWGRQKGYGYETMLTGGVLTQKDEQDSPSRAYDRWRNRLMFPITNPQGRVIGFSGRVLDAEQKGGKYINSPETPVFHKSAVLYALFQARKGIKERKSILLCEGQMDAIACHAAGITNAVAPQGTAFTEQQAKLIKRYSDSVVVCFDSDTAGVNAAIKCIEPLMAAELNCRVVLLDQGDDPDSLVQRSGPEALQQKIDSAIDYFEFFIDMEIRNSDGSPAAKSRIVQNFLQIVAKLTSPVIRAEYCQLVAGKLGLQLQPVFQELNTITNQGRRNQVFNERGGGQFNGQGTFQKGNFQKGGFQKGQGYQKFQRNTRRSGGPPTQAYGNDYQNAQEMPPPFPSNPLMDDGMSKDKQSGVIEAETQLLDLCLHHEPYANRLESELELSFISKTPVGNALNDLLAFTAQGEWDMAADIFKQELSKYDCPQLIKALNDPEYGIDVDQRKVEQCFDDCFSRVMLEKLNGMIKDNEQLQSAAAGMDETRKLLTDWKKLTDKRNRFEALARNRK